MIVTPICAFSLEAGFDGLYAFENFPFKLRYDFANAVNDNDALTWTPGNPNDGIDDDIYIRTARWRRPCPPVPTWLTPRLSCWYATSSAPP